MFVNQDKIVLGGDPWETKDTSDRAPDKTRDLTTEWINTIYFVFFVIFIYCFCVYIYVQTFQSKCAYVIVLLMCKRSQKCWGIFNDWLKKGQTIGLYIAITPFQIIPECWISTCHQQKACSCPLICVKEKQCSDMDTDNCYWSTATEGKIRWWVPPTSRQSERQACRTRVAGLHLTRSQHLSGCHRPPLATLCMCVCVLHISVLPWDWIPFVQQVWHGKWLRNGPLSENAAEVKALWCWRWYEIPWVSAITFIYLVVGSRIPTVRDI